MKREGIGHKIMFGYMFRSIQLYSTNYKIDEVTTEPVLVKCLLLIHVFADCLV